MSVQLFFTLFILLVTKSVLVNSAANYSKDTLRNKYPGYGTKWIYFPNGKGIPTVGYLEMPTNDFPAASDPNDIEKSLTFRLYTRALKDGTIVSLSNKDGIKLEFDTNKHTKFITHGWLSNGKSDTCLFIKDAYLFKEDVNVIILDWSKIAGNIFYPIPMAHTKEVGKYYAKFINYLLEIGANSSSMHLIGHSLGAHVSGFAGRIISTGKPKRITGLDPALPGFNRGFQVDHLSPTDADFVDIIHTCGGVLGILQNLGHADFYPNGGVPPQPGCCCVAEFIEACSHGRSWKYFAESIISEQKFMAWKCKSWDDYLGKFCEKDLVPMGNPTPSFATGSYYLATESSPPFARTITSNNIEIKKKMN